MYTVSEDGLITGDSIKEITLTPSTTARTENGTISVSGVKIENAAGADVTANYDITMVNGNLKITHDAALALSGLKHQRQRPRIQQAIP
ncbi:MAG: hypothetical protein ACLRI8_02950 [Agathobacter rectalis]